MVPYETLAELYKMLSDATRVRLLWRLRGGSRCVGDLCQGLDVSSSAVSHQLSKLKAARLIAEERQGRQRVYRLADNHVEQLLDMGLAHVMEE